MPQDQSVEPLWRLASEGQVDALRAALDAGSDPNLPGPYGWAPLVWAVVGEKQATEEDRIKCVHLMLKVDGKPGEPKKDEDARKARVYAHIPRYVTPPSIEAFGLASITRNIGRANRHDDRYVRAIAWLWRCELATHLGEDMPKVATWLDEAHLAIIRDSVVADLWEPLRMRVYAALGAKEASRKDAGYVRQ